MKALLVLSLVFSTAICLVADTARDGSSPARAIVLRGSGKVADAEICRCIRQRYADARCEPLGRAVGFDGRTYIATITFSTAHHGKHSMFFDITHVD